MPLSIDFLTYLRYSMYRKEVLIYMIKLNGMVIHEPLFRKLEIKNLKQSDKEPVTLNVRINKNTDKIIYTGFNMKKLEVIGYVDPDTGLFVGNIEDVKDKSNVHYQFQKKAEEFAEKEFEKEYNRLRSLTPDEYKNLKYKPLEKIVQEAYEFLNDGFRFFKPIQQQVNYIKSRIFPRANEYLSFADDEPVEHLVTHKLPYNNPKKQTLTTEQKEIVDRFLDTFLEKVDKEYLSCYLGACLLNLNVHDERISKMLVVSARSGLGKSSLITGLMDALFTRNFYATRSTFDRCFTMDSRFSISSLSTKRITLYSEATFSDGRSVQQADGTRETPSDFSGLFVDDIKTLITEGRVVSERKFEGINDDELNGFHVVLSNNLPVITKTNNSLRRRILAITIKPTIMEEKATALGLTGRGSFGQYIKDNVQAFANYFVQEFLTKERLCMDYIYDKDELEQEIEDVCEIHEQQTKLVKDEQKTLGLVSALEYFQMINNENLGRLIDDINHVLNGNAKDVNMYLSEHGHLVINSSKNYLRNYTSKALELRRFLKEISEGETRKTNFRAFKLRIDPKITNK